MALVVDAAVWTERAYAHLLVGRMLAADLADGEPTNCLLWALGKQASDGGLVILVQSHYGPWLHARWQRLDGRIFEYVPTDDKYRQAQPPTTFVGQVQEWIAS